MYKIICFLFLSFFINKIEAQDTRFAITSKVSGDSLYIKWVPKDIKTFQAILLDTTEITWVECDKNALLTSVVFTGENKFSIVPYKEKSEKFLADNPGIFSFSEALIDTENPDSSKMGPSFGYALIQNFLDKRIANATGNLIFIPNCLKNKKYAIRIRNSKLEKDYIFIVDPNKKVIDEIETTNLTFNQKNVYYTWSTKGLNSSFCAYNIYKRRGDEKQFSKLNADPIVPFSTKADADPNLKERLDKDIKQGETYYYQVKAIDFFGDETGKSEIKKIYIPREVNGAVVFDTVYANYKLKDRVFKGSFTSEDTTTQIHVSEVILLRSDSLRSGYQEMGKIKITNPALPFEFTLHGYKSGETYHYKFLAISEDKDTIESYPEYFFTYDQDPPDPVTNVVGLVDSLGIVHISWTAPIDKDLSGYRIFRGNQKSDEFTEINPNFITDTKTTDTLDLSSLTNEIYYFVKVVDENFNNSISSDTVLFMKPDTIAPSSGVFMPHTFSEKGVKLCWNNCRANDLKAQYILRKEATTPETTILTWTDTVQKAFVDTNVQSGKHYIYTLVAEDKSLNRDVSEEYYVNYELGYREAIKNLKYTIDREKKCVVLSWDYDPKEVYTFQIYRCKENGPWSLYKTIDGTEKQELVDTYLTINTVFKYKIVAMLNSGLLTKMSIPVEVLY